MLRNLLSITTLISLSFLFCFSALAIDLTEINTLQDRRLEIVAERWNDMAEFVMVKEIMENGFSGSISSIKYGAPYKKKEILATIARKVGYQNALFPKNFRGLVKEVTNGQDLEKILINNALHAIITPKPTLPKEQMDKIQRVAKALQGNYIMYQLESSTEDQAGSGLVIFDTQNGEILFLEASFSL